jgi:D-arabinose 1-dehydrogenase-like Zn-dependent alcohol dehydrogenase
MRIPHDLECGIRVLAKERHIYRIPESVSDAEAAPLFCPGITAFSAVAKARLTPGKTLALFGFGGVGHMVQQLAQLAGAEVTVVARTASHLALATKLGAARTIDLSTTDADDVLRKSGGADAAILLSWCRDMRRASFRGIATPRDLRVARHHWSRLGALLGRKGSAGSRAG